MSAMKKKCTDGVLVCFEMSYVVLLSLNCGAVNSHRLLCTGNKLLLLLLGLQGPGVFLVASDLCTQREVCLFLAIHF